jgi:hypothetical protein
MDFWYKKPINVNEVVDSVGGYMPSQPSQKFPFHPIQPPRVDNKNQPWYGGTRWWGVGPDIAQSNDAAIKTKNNEDRYQVKDVWSYLNDWFGGLNLDANLSDKSQIPKVEIPEQRGRYNMNDQSGFVRSWDYDERF